MGMKRELTDADRASLAAAFWRGMHREGRPLAWNDMSADEQRTALQRHQPSDDGPPPLNAHQLQQIHELLAAAVAAQPRALPPKALARALGEQIRTYAPSRAEVATLVESLESTLRAHARAAELLTTTFEALDSRIRSLEGRN
jgi:hypothetical protein